MLITCHPLFSSKSFHKTWESLQEKIEDVLKLTEEYYELQGKEFSPRTNFFSGEYPGILVYKIYPEKPHLMKLLGETKTYKKPEELDGLDSSNGQSARTRQESENTMHISD